MDNDLMTIKQVADYLQLKPKTIYTWVAIGKLKPIRLGRTLRFDAESIRALKERGLK